MGCFRDRTECTETTVEETLTAVNEAKVLTRQSWKRRERQPKKQSGLPGEQAEKAAALQAEKELMASLIFCEAGNQPYEGQVAVGAVVLNRVKSSVYPNSVSEVIYQSGQFSPAMSGWLDRVRANAGYSESALQAAEDALNGSNPVGDCFISAPVDTECRSEIISSTDISAGMH